MPNLRTSRHSCTIPRPPHGANTHRWQRHRCSGNADTQRRTIYQHPQPTPFVLLTSSNPNEPNQHAELHYHGRRTPISPSRASSMSHLNPPPFIMLTSSNPNGETTEHAPHDFIYSRPEALGHDIITHPSLLSFEPTSYCFFMHCTYKPVSIAADHPHRCRRASHFLRIPSATATLFTSLSWTVTITRIGPATAQRQSRPTTRTPCKGGLEQRHEPTCSARRIPRQHHLFPCVGRKSSPRQPPTLIGTKMKPWKFI